MGLFKIVSEFSKLLQSRFTVTDILRNYTQLQNWLQSDAPKELEADDFVSNYYWKAESAVSILETEARRDSGFIQSDSDEEMD